MPADFALRHEPQPEGRRVMAAAGELDLYTAPDLRRLLTQVIEDGTTGVVIDLSETTFLDSTGLGVLIGALKRLRSRGGALAA
jgi:anti-sigma B factor antagonist